VTPRVGDAGARLSALGSRLPAAESREPTAESRAQRLRATARQLEGVFVEQMFKAMRETVPEGGATSGGSGEEMFTGMLDQSLAGEVPARWSNGLAEALYRQLQRAAGLEGVTEGTAPAAPSAAPSSPAAPVPILESSTSTSAAPARAVLTEPQ
jgi:flagellar protein FlgJ